MYVPDRVPVIALSVLMGAKVSETSAIEIYQRVADGPWPIIGGDPQGTRDEERGGEVAGVARRRPSPDTP